jgi:hypothetical protein
MESTSKPVRLSRHASEQLVFRGTTEEEVVEAIRKGAWELAEKGRRECRVNYSFDDEWNGVFYKTKQVRPIFVEEEMEIVVITVYVYFF